MPTLLLLHINRLYLQQAWSDRREPPALRAAIRRVAASTATAASADDLSKAAQEKKHGDQTSFPLSPSAFPSGNEGDASGNGHSHNESSACDVRLLFVSGTGLASRRRARGTIGGLARSRGGDNNGGTQRAMGAPPEDMWRVLGRELWNPWPQADVVVHTGSQVRTLPHGKFEHAVRFELRCGTAPNVPIFCEGSSLS